MIYDFIFATKELSKVVYALSICLICAIIVLKTDRLFKLSDHQGLRYFRNSFLFYGISFITRYILGGISNPLNSSYYNQLYLIIINHLSNFFIIVASLFLLYSLVWKYIDKKKRHRSFLNMQTIIIYLLSFIIVLLNYVLKMNYLFYIFQILLFTSLTIISLSNCLDKKQRNKISKYYFLTLFLGLMIWVSHLFAYLYTNLNSLFNLLIYTTNILFFMSFLISISKLTNKKNG